MIQLQRIHLAYAGDPILQDLSWSISPGERIGLIGPNGAGKTTLLRLIAGRETPDQGTIQKGGQTIGYLEQGVHELEGGEPNQSIREAALQAFSDTLRLERKEQKISDELEAESDYTSDYYQKLLDRLQRVQEKLNAKQSHTIRTRTDSMLTGLGFAPEELDEPIRSFSGGWRMRVALAKLLLQEPDVLLLDEPTNHLDIDSIDWIEEYLKGFEGTAIIVSHDRYFLDRMIETTAELANGGITVYDGNYSYYLEARKERRKLQRQRYENQQKRIKEIEEFIDKFRYNASKASQVQSRIKKLEKMERIPPPPPEDPEMTLRFPSPTRSGQVVMELSEFSKVYANEDGVTEVFDDAGPLTIERGEKIALIGPNGAGKSTLMRILRGSEPFQGEREEGHNVEMTFFSQHQGETLDLNKTVLESVREQAPDKDDTELRTILGAFLFTGDDVFKSVSVLSGGEKSRVALARTFLSPANFLLLDEPTNHLDLQSKKVLTEALQEYQGTFVVVSHDRHFLSEIADTIWRVEAGRVIDFPGDYEEYRWHREHGSKAWSIQHDDSATSPSTSSQNGKSQSGTSGGPKSKEQKRREAQERNREYQQKQASEHEFAGLNAYQLQQKIDKVEAEILEKEEKQEELQEQLADPTIYDDNGKAKQLNQEYGQIEQDLTTLYEKWETLADYLQDAKAS